MLRQSSQAGSVIEWLVFGIFIVGVAALIAWRYLEVDRAQTEAQRALSSSTLLSEPKKAE